MLVHEVRSPVAALSAIAETVADPSSTPPPRGAGRLALAAWRDRANRDGRRGRVDTPRGDRSRRLVAHGRRGVLRGARVEVDIAVELP